MSLDLTEFAGDLEEIRDDLSTNVTLSSGTYQAVVSSTTETKNQEEAGFMAQYDGVVVFLKADLGANIPNVNDEAVINSETYRLAERLKDSFQAGVRFALKKQN